MSKRDIPAEVTDKLVDIPAPFIDERGVIQSIVSLDKCMIGSAVLIESKKGSIRANHYHKEDWHYCYFLSGSSDYYYRPAGSMEPPKRIRVDTGQMVYTPPLLEHAMVFLEDSVFLTLGGGTRQQADYEDDLVRVELILSAKTQSA